MRYGLKLLFHGKYHSVYVDGSSHSTLIVATEYLTWHRQHSYSKRSHTNQFDHLIEIKFGNEYRFTLENMKLRASITWEWKQFGFVHRSFMFHTPLQAFSFRLIRGRLV